MSPADLRPIADHLWQSTIFALAAALLTLALRTNRARLRYWLWLAASVKFLVPLSILIAAGSHLAWRTVPVQTYSPISAVIQEVSQPFSIPAASHPLPPPALPARNPLPAALFAIWIAGFSAIALSWYIGWRRIHAAVRRALPVPLALPLPVRSSPARLEPGVFGVFRPILLLPQGIFERLTPAQLEAVLAHELCHYRCRDNLTAAIQMFVETVFWFHPLVWWIGKRMLWERERACDEEVLFFGSQPRIYAQGILEVCKLYVESPLACVSGVTGASLKRRIEAIVAARRALPVTLPKRLMLAAAAAAALALPIALGILHAPLIRAQTPREPDWQAAAGGKMSFDVASVKLDKGPFRSPSFPLDNGNAYVRSGRLSADFALMTYIQFAYKIRYTADQREALLAHWPRWIESDRFSIEASAGGLVTKDQMRLMMQSLLADRFKLAAHFETQDSAVLALTLAKPGKTGPRLRPHSEGPPCDDAAAATAQPARAADAPFPDRCYVQALTARGRELHAGSRNTTVDQLAEALAALSPLGRPVIDRTGLTVPIDYEIRWTRDPNPAQPPDPNPPSDPGPSFLEALREQLGLKLEPTRAPLRVLVIDHVERPSEN